MSAEQNYVGGGSHESKVDSTAKNKALTASQPDMPPAKAELGIDLTLLTHSGRGSSEVNTLVWALEAQRNYWYKQLIAALTSENYLDAFRADVELANINSILISVTMQATARAETNYWASLQRPPRDGFTFEQEQQMTAKWLRENTQIDPDTVDLH